MTLEWKQTDQEPAIPTHRESRKRRREETTGEIDATQVEALRLEVAMLRHQLQQLNHQMLSVMQSIITRNQNVWMLPITTTGCFPSVPTTLPPLDMSALHIMSHQPSSLPPTPFANRMNQTHPSPSTEPSSATTAAASVDDNDPPSSCETPQENPPTKPQKEETNTTSADVVVRETSRLAAEARSELLESMISRMIAFVRLHSSAPKESVMVAMALSLQSDIEEKLVKVNASITSLAASNDSMYHANSEAACMYRIEILKFIAKELPRSVSEAVEKRLPPMEKKRLNRSLLASVVQQAQCALETQMHEETTTRNA